MMSLFFLYKPFMDGGDNVKVGEPLKVIAPPPGSKSTFGAMKSNFGSTGGTIMTVIMFIIMVILAYWAYYHFVKKQPAPLFAKLMRKPGFGRRR
jgi:hypothetical protein